MAGIHNNYGGVLIIFDRWFGTYEEEVEKVEYGVTCQIKSHNFLVLKPIHTWAIVRGPCRMEPSIPR